MLGWLQGLKKKKITKGEKLIKKFRRSIYCVKNIKKGELFTKKNIKVIRPNGGLAPKYYFKIIGKKAKKDILIGDKVKFSNF